MFLYENLIVAVEHLLEYDLCIISECVFRGALTYTSLIFDFILQREHKCLRRSLDVKEHPHALPVKAVDIQYVKEYML